MVFYLLLGLSLAVGVYLIWRSLQTEEDVPLWLVLTGGVLAASTGATFIAKVVEWGGPVG